MQHQQSSAYGQADLQKAIDTARANKVSKLYKAMFNFPTGMAVLEAANEALAARVKDASLEVALKQALANLVLPSPKPYRQFSESPETKRLILAGNSINPGYVMIIIIIGLFFPNPCQTRI